MCWKSARADSLRVLAAAALALALLPAWSAPCSGDTMARAQCSGQLRIGVRNDYPPFAMLQDGLPAGFEIELARRLAASLGLVPVFRTVTPANRIAALAEDRVDLVIATMGHTLQRDAEARFVRPHYYQSRTVVLGDRRRRLDGMAAIAGQTVCVSIGNSTNAELAERGANLMLFGSAQQLIEQLERGACRLAAQDDSLFATPLERPSFAARHEIKFGFSPQPWGMAVHAQRGERLAAGLARALRDLHADGSLVALAHAHGVDSGFLLAEQARWRSSPCASGDAAFADPRCVAAPHDSRLQPTPFAPAVQRLEDWLERQGGPALGLTMLKTRVGFELFLKGIAYSLLLVAGAVTATLACSAGFALALGARSAWLRAPPRLLLMTAQSTPLVLLMLFAGILVAQWGALSAPGALLTAVLVLGLFNGSSGGQAVAEARAALRDAGRPAQLRDGLLQARAQLVAFAVNATRGSPAASLIGVPELLSAQTDIASFASERLFSFTLLLLFYMAVVSTVVWLGRRWLERLP